MDINNLRKSIVEKKLIIISFVVGVFLIGGIGIMAVTLSNRDNLEQDSFSSSDIGSDEIEGSELDVETDSEQGECEINVDIGGAVNEPGVYCVSTKEILDDLLEQAGGLTDKVCQKWVDRELNRSSLLEPNSKIYIPFEDDPECVENSEVTFGADVGDTSSTTGKVSINNASSSELESLSGVGPSTAAKIIEGRPYKKLEDLMNVKGIGEATFEKLKDQICL